MKTHNSGFIRPIKMIETGKYSSFKGLICNTDYHDAPSISRYFYCKRIRLSSHVCKPAHSGEKEYKYPKTLNRKQRNVCKNISIHFPEVNVTLIFPENEKKSEENSVI